MNAYLKFDEIWSICSQDIERKQNFGVNQVPEVWYKFAENYVYRSQDRCCQYQCIFKIW